MIKLCRWFFIGLYNIITFIPRYFIEGLLCFIDPKRKKSVTYKGKPLIPRLILGLTLSVYLICIFLSSKWYVQNLKIKYLANDIKESTKILEKEDTEEINKTEYTPSDTEDYSNISYLAVDFTDLIKKNDETVAWIRVNNTKVDYSVLQHSDNSYYLTHDFNRYNNYAGWIFADYRDNLEYFGNNTIIYGHNMNDRSMFGSLVWALKESWYTNTDNHYIKLSTPTSNTVWRIFSIYSIVPEVYYLKTYFTDEEEHSTFINTIKERSIYDFNLDVTSEDKILTLSTCSDDGTKRVVIHAKMIKAEYR